MIYVLKEERITPVCAGSTHIWHQAEAHGRDHPHLRGEYLHESGFKSVAEGSPPLARGILLSLVCKGLMHRITPACAGSTISERSFESRRWDHPRLRGEYKRRKKQVIKATGSPPLARGSTREMHHCVGGPKDHPRLRGEYN